MRLDLQSAADARGICAQVKSHLNTVDEGEYLQPWYITSASSQPSFQLFGIIGTPPWAVWICSGFSSLEAQLAITIDYMLFGEPILVVGPLRLRHQTIERETAVTIVLSSHRRNVCMLLCGLTTSSLENCGLSALMALSPTTQFLYGRSEVALCKCIF